MEERMNFLRIVRHFSAALWALVALTIASPIHAQLATFWSLSENQLDIKEGGRVNSIAVNPDDSNKMFVASETGGLFKSTDGGLHWQHVDKLGVIFTQSVAYLPSDSSVVFVSAKADFKTGNGGGVWRSKDGGDNWFQMPLLVPDNPGERLSAYEISIAPVTEAVFVATSDGVAIGFHGGADWGRMPVFSIGDKTVFSMLATDTEVYAGGPSGTRVIPNFNVQSPSWINPVGSPGEVQDMHAFGKSPLDGQALAINTYTELKVTQNHGLNWASIASPHGAANCAGTPFIKAVDRTPEGGRYLSLYLSNRCGLYSLNAPVNGTSVNYLVGAWAAADVDHAGPRDLVAGASIPLLGTAGGLHKAVALNVWRFAGGGRQGGYNAQQINEVNGQRVGNALTDLYVGMRDTKLWASALSGDIVNSYGSDGHHIGLERTVEPAAVSAITFATNNNLDRESQRYFADPHAFSDAPGHRGAPVLTRHCEYLQDVNRSLIFRSPGMVLKEDCDQPWERFAFFNEQPSDVPKVGLGLDGTTNPAIVYQPYKSNALPPEWAGASQLMQIARPAFSTEPATVHYLPMELFGIGITPTAFGGYPVYAVDPASPGHIIAADVVSGQMMETRNSGLSWTRMSDLMDRLSEAGVLFNTDLQGRSVGKIFPVVTAISFCPNPATLVLAGTNEGGIFASKDNGGTWFKVPGSQLATYVTSFFWETTNTVYVSTYGRGLWKLKNKRIAAPGQFDDLCPKCDVVSNSGPGRPPFDGSALVFDGRILGVRTEKSQLREVFVTPGSSVVFTGDPKDPQDDIAITESDGRDTTQFEPLPARKDGWIVTGVVFTNDDMLTGTVYAESEMSSPKSKDDTDPEIKGSTKSPAEGKPYISLDATTVEPEELLELSATDFASGASYELLVDGQPIKGEIQADGSGSFTARITAPTTSGYHIVTVRMVGTESVIDGATFFVSYGY
jgi:photosystem II stability/assembly factor-like uncharacterized protein